MEHIVQEGINTKKQQSGGIFEDLMKTLSKKEKQENLVQYTSPAKVWTWLLTVQSYSSRPSASSFFKFLATGGANCNIKLN